MTIRYVGAGGNDSNDGLSWANRKLTLNGAEDSPVAAGDIVYVGAGVYREMLTVDVSGSAGNPIEYIGDYDGSHTDGVGGVVRITGSDNDQTSARANCVTASSKIYRTFTGFQFDLTTSHLISSTDGTNWVINKCSFNHVANANCFRILGSAQASWTIRNCLFYQSGGSTPDAVLFTHTSTVNNTGHIVENCLFVCGGRAVDSIRVGGVTVRNCVCIGQKTAAIAVATALAVGQVMTVNNCIVTNCATGLSATTTAEFSEDYNSLSGNTTDRSNVTAGANSNTYPPLFDPRWFFQLVSAGAGPNHATQMVTPFDLASFSQLINLAGTSPSSTDMRGTAIQNTQREWGALEYDSTLSVKARQASSIDGGGMVV